MAEPDREIGALFEQIDNVVVKVQLDRNVGIGDKKINDCGRVRARHRTRT